MAGTSVTLAILDTLLYLLAPFLPLLPVLVYRKRLVAWFARQIGPYVVQGVAAWAFVVEDMEAEDGTRTQRRALSGPAKALLGATVPVLLAEVMKNLKFKQGGGGGLPAGIDLSNLSSALPALLGSGMIPKKYAGILAIAAPILQGFLGGAAPGSKPASKSTPEIPGPGGMR